jgi:hypothetical protein
MCLISSNSPHLAGLELTETGWKKRAQNVDLDLQERALVMKDLMTFPPKTEPLQS